MARKTNKTAHVLNLLSGSGTQKSPKEEPVSEEQNSVQKTPAVSIVKIDNDAEDSVSDIIHQQLLSAFMDETPDSTSESSHEETLPQIDQIQNESGTPDTLKTEQADLETVSDSLQTETQDDTAQTESEPEPEIEKDTQEVMQETLPEPEPEPDFVILNVLERIVRDKIIYFMRQFDVCTCDRCVADTVALTLNGLNPKYIVTPPAAVSPLISFYTSKYISDITVEATKACMTIKEHPRHKKTDETF